MRRLSKQWLFAMLLILVVPMLVACGGGSATSVPATSAPTTAATTAPTSNSAQNPTEAPTTAPTEAVQPTEAATTAPTEAATGTGPDMSKTIIIGMNQFPDTLFGIESQSSATTQVLQAIQPACVNSLSYEYQAVCFEKIPTLADGDAVTKTVTVDNTYTGNIVVDGKLITDTSTITAPITTFQAVVTWKLIDGLTWEDGTPVKASDFVFAGNLYQDPGIKIATRNILDRTEKYEAPDDKTLIWYSAPGYIDATYFLNFFGPEPEHVLKDAKPAEIGGSEYASKPLAYGPYKIAENTPQESTKLVANETYWRKGFPKVGNITFKYLTSEDQILQQLESSEIDVVGQIGLTLANAPKLDELEQAGVIKPQYVPATVWEHVDFGTARADGQPSIFADVKVRQAVAYAINRQSIIDNVLFGKTVVMNSFIPQDHWAYPPNGAGLEKYEYNPDKAKQMLDEAGWVEGSDGIREKDGVKMKAQFYTTENNQTRASVAQLIQEDLKAVGIDMEMQFVPGTAVLFKNGEEGILQGRRFDLALYAWISGPEPGVTLFQCEAIPDEANGFSGQNTPAWCNEEFDTFSNQALQETDRAKRIPLFIKAQEIFNAELPTFPLYQRVNVGAQSSKVTGLELNPTSTVDFWNIDEWDINK